MEPSLDFFSSPNLAVNQFNLSVWISLAAFCLYLFLANSPIIQSRFGGNLSTTRKWTIKRIFGFIFLGVAPALLVVSSDQLSLTDTGLNLNWHPNTWIWLLIIIGIILVINLLASKGKVNLKQYPQIREQFWKKETFIAEYGGWFIFLLGYEYLFRGLLLFGTIPLVGPTAAIAINVTIYSLAHIVKGWQETFGSIVLGLILCYFTVLSGSIWFALIVHVSQAWINSFLSFRNHPEMRYVGK